MSVSHPEGSVAVNGGVTWPRGEVVELSLLLPARQVAALEMAAHERGLSTGTLVRSLLEAFVRETISRLPA